MKLYIYFILFSVILLTSCSEDNTTAPQPNTNNEAFIDIIDMDSTILDKINVEIFYPDSVIFNCELKDTSKFSSLTLLIWNSVGQYQNMERCDDKSIHISLEASQRINSNYKKYQFFNDAYYALSYITTEPNSGRIIAQIYINKE